MIRGNSIPNVSIDVENNTKTIVQEFTAIVVKMTVQSSPFSRRLIDQIHIKASRLPEGGYISFA